MARTITRAACGERPAMADAREWPEIAAYLRALNESEDLHSTLIATVKTACSLMRAAQATLLLANDAGTELILGVMHGSTDALAEQHSVTVDPLLLQRLLEAQEPITIDGNSGRQFWSSLLRACAEAERHLLAPITRNGVLLAVLVLGFARPTQIGARDEASFASFLHQAAIGLHKARALDTSFRKIEHLSAVVALDEALTTMPSMREMLGQIIDRIKQLIDVEMAGLFLYENETDALILQQPFQSTADITKQYRVPLKGGGCAVYVFETGKPYLTNDVPNDPIGLQHIARSLGSRNTICAPLQVDNRRLGVLMAMNKRSGDFTESDLRLLCLLASHLGVLIENAQLLEDQRTAVTQLQELNRVIDQQRDGLERTLAIHDELTSMVLDGQDIADIVAALGKLLANPVAVEDRFCNLIAYCPLADSNDLDEGRRLMIANGGTVEEIRGDPEVRAALAGLGQRRRPVRMAPLPHIGLDKPRVVAPIVVGRETMGYVYVLESNRPLDELDFMALERAAMGMALQMMKEKAAVEAQYKLRGDLVAELLGDNHSPDEVLNSRAVYLGIDLRVPRAMLVVEVDAVAGAADARRTEEALALQSKVLAVTERLCGRRAPGSVVSLRGDEVIVLAAMQSRTGDQRRAEIAGLADAVRAEVPQWLPEVTVSVGIGSIGSNLAAYASAYQQARSALDVVKALRQRDRTLAFDQLGIYSLLCDPLNHSRLGEFVANTIGGVLEYDRVHGTQMTETLHQYLLHDGHLDQSAKALHVHKNTLRYRLQRIEDITKTELHGVEARCELHLALKVHYSLHLG